jgi:hypothetical protein
VAAEQLPVVPVDLPSGEPGKSSVRYASEMHPPKRATDIVLVGNGYAPGGRPVPYFGVSISVGSLKKVVHVFGDRVWKSGLMNTAAPSDPLPAAEVPLLFEKAFGGRHDLPGGAFVADPRNPVGVGFRGKRSAAEMNGTPVPNLESPRQPIHSLSDQPPPAGVGFISPAWQPRSSYAGTYDEAWKKKRAPYLPADFNPLFWQAAPPDQIYPGYLQGGEPVELINASPAGVQRFVLPRCQLAAAAVMPHRMAPLKLVLDTLLLEPDQDRFTLLWHGSTRCDKEALKIQMVQLLLEGMEGVQAS